MTKTPLTTQPFHLLALEASGDACSVALLTNAGTDQERVIASYKKAPMQQAKLMLPAIQALLDSASLKMDQLHAVAYGCGPGSFTGLRLVCSVVQAIGFTNNIPAIPVSSLAAIAQSAHLEYQWKQVLVAFDARKGQLYWGAYQLNESGCMELMGEEKLMAPEEIDLLAFAGWRGVGDGWRVYRETLSQRGKLPVQIGMIESPSAEAILTLARQKFANKVWISASDAIPVYLNPFKR